MQEIMQSMLDMGIPATEKIIRTVAVYAFLLLGFRLLGKREMGEFNPADLIILLLISNTVQDAMVGDDQSLVGGLVGAAVMMLLNHLAVRLTFRGMRTRRALDGTPDDLIKEGHIVTEALRRNQVSREEIAAAARRVGIENIAHVRHARLEVGGGITFYKKEEYDAAALARKIDERLAAIEQRLAAVS